MKNREKEIKKKQHENNPSGQFFSLIAYLFSVYIYILDVLLLNNAGSNISFAFNPLNIKKCRSKIHFLYLLNNDKINSLLYGPKSNKFISP
jgi:hypothetical protein